MNLRNGIFKILSLSFGFAVGIVLIAKVCHELSYDTYYNHRERVYKIMTGVERHDEEPYNVGKISGAVAPGFKEFVPGVEAATRVTGLFDNTNYYTSDRNRIEANLLLADTSFFDIFSRTVYAGDPHRIFAEWGKVMVSESFAAKLGGVQQALGQTIYNESMPSVKFTVEGVYEDFPANSSFARTDILLSLATYSKASTQNWVGNDRYEGYVKLDEGVDPNSLKDAIHKMQQANQPLEQLEQDGLKLWYFLERGDTLHLKDSTNRNMVLMLSIVALLLIAASAVNYILNTISLVVQRAKEIGVRKCYGAGNSSILALVFKETVCNVVLSVAVAAGIIMAFQGKIEQLLNTPISFLFNSNAIIAVALVCVLVLLVTSIVPARIFMGIPVAAAFRNYRESKRRWKLVFLAVQFTFTVFLVCVLAIFGKQYNMMLNENLGYEYDNLLVVSIPGGENDDFFKVKDKLDAHPWVTGVALVSDLPMNSSSGNNVWLPGSGKELFNIADQYYSTFGSAEVLGIEFIEGREARTPKEVAVSRKFVEKMQNFVSWEDGAIGKSVFITEHSRKADDIFTICGVYEDYKIGAVLADERPSVRFGADRGDANAYFLYVVAKVSQITPELIATVQSEVEELVPDISAGVEAYSDGMLVQFADLRRVKDSILIGGIFSLVISIMGLIGYIRDETRRRSAEMAIRKINGALPGEVTMLFVKDIVPLALFAVVFGNVAAYVLGDMALQMFRDKAQIGGWMYIASDIAVVAVILVTVVVNSLRISRSNPVNSLCRGE